MNKTLKTPLKNLLAEVYRVSGDGMLDLGPQFDRAVIDARIHLWIAENDIIGAEESAKAMRKAFWDVLTLVQGKIIDTDLDEIDWWWCVDADGNIYDPWPNHVVKYIPPLQETPPQQKAIQYAMDCKNPIIQAWVQKLLDSLAYEHGGGGPAAIAKELDVPAETVIEWYRDLNKINGGR